MIQFGLHSDNEYIKYGNREDVCTICAIEKIREDKKNHVENAGWAKARHDLAGQQAARPLFTVPTGASEPTFICEKHMREIANEMSAMAKGEVLTEENKR